MIYLQFDCKASFLFWQSSIITRYTHWRLYENYSGFKNDDDGSCLKVKKKIKINSSQIEISAMIKVEELINILSYHWDRKRV